MLDEGFRADDPRYRMAQLSDAMTRICRLISGIQLHTGSWTVDQAAALFEQKAHLPPPAARQEAERGTYDPTYGGQGADHSFTVVYAEELGRSHTAGVSMAFSVQKWAWRAAKPAIAPMAMPPAKENHGQLTMSTSTSSGLIQQV